MSRRPGAGAIVAVALALSVALPAAAKGPKAPTKAPNKAIDWLEVVYAGGKRVWMVPEGWEPARGVDEEEGHVLIYDAPDQSGRYTLTAYPREDDKTCPGLLSGLTNGGKPKKQKGTICAEGKEKAAGSGERRLAACAREDKGGYIVVALVSATPETYKKLGGTSKLREAAARAVGITPPR